MRTITLCTTISRENEDNIQFLAIAIRNFHSATNNETTVREDYITILEQYNTFQQYTIGLIEAMYDIHRKEQGYPSLHLFKNPQPQPCLLNLLLVHLPLHLFVLMSLVFHH